MKTYDSTIFEIPILTVANHTLYHSQSRDIKYSRIICLGTFQRSLFTFLKLTIFSFIIYIVCIFIAV